MVQPATGGVTGAGSGAAGAAGAGAGFAAGAALVQPSEPVVAAAPVVDSALSPHSAAAVALRWAVVLVQQEPLYFVEPAAEPRLMSVVGPGAGAGC